VGEKGLVLIAYSGAYRLKVRSGVNAVSYEFAPGDERYMDIRDVGAILPKWADVFAEVERCRK